MGDKIGTALCWGLLLATSSLARDAAIKDYMVSMQVRAGETVVGQPTVEAAAGQTAEVHLDGGYSIRVTATPDSVKPGNVLLTSEILVKSGGSQRRQTSTLSLRPKETMTFNFAPNAGDNRSVRVAISAVSVDS